MVKKKCSDGFRTFSDGFQMCLDGFRTFADGFRTFSDGFRTFTDGFRLFSDGFRTFADGFRTAFRYHGQFFADRSYLLFLIFSGGAKRPKKMLDAKTGAWWMRVAPNKK